MAHEVLLQYGVGFGGAAGVKVTLGRGCLWVASLTPRKGKSCGLRGGSATASLWVVGQLGSSVFLVWDGRIHLFFPSVEGPTKHMLEDLFVNCSIDAFF